RVGVGEVDHHLGAEHRGALLRGVGDARQDGVVGLLDRLDDFRPLAPAGAEYTYLDQGGKPTAAPARGCGRAAPSGPPRAEMIPSDRCREDGFPSRGGRGAAALPAREGRGRRYRWADRRTGPRTGRRTATGGRGTSRTGRRWAPG